VEGDVQKIQHGGDGERTERVWIRFGSAPAGRRCRGDVACGERGCLDVHQMCGDGTEARRDGGVAVRAQQQGRVGVQEREAGMMWSWSTRRRVRADG
jgi:hypothetical protein